ncbi:MAG: hypothetical protein NPIRA04_15500 [Nitrospirales bacterium]|nr:MAG: hypothetical protein NPIRA04_15500 [Nitrospirales bacterium]
MAWEIEIKGDEDVLLALSRTDEVKKEEEYVLEGRDNKFVLCGKAFLQFQDAEKVREYGEKVTKLLSGTARIHLGSQKKISMIAVLKINENGAKDIFVIPDPANFRVEASMSVSAVVMTKDGKIKEEPHPAKSVFKCITKALKNEAVAKALRLRDEDNLEWVQLYRIYEVIESDIPKKDMVNKGWSSKKKIDLFKQTANSVKAIGDQARHGKEYTEPPSKPMDIWEAKGLVDDLLKQWFFEL